MYAIIADGSHQYQVEEGQILAVQRKDLSDNEKTLSFDRVLLIGGIEGGPRVGRPLVEGAKVTANVLGEFKGDKIVVQKFRRRKNYRVRKGHRQKYLRVAITEILM